MPEAEEAEGPKSYLITIVLAMLFGMFGADRFYLGKVGTGLIKLVTLGGAGIFYLVDIILTVSGRQRDSLGRPLKGSQTQKRTAWGILGVIFGLYFIFVALMSQSVATVEAPRSTLFVSLLIGVGLTALGGWILLDQHRKQTSYSPTPTYTGGAPAMIEERLEALETLQGIYLTHSATGDALSTQVATTLGNIITNTSVLFDRLESKATRQESSRAQRHYEEILKAVTSAFGPDQFLDTMRHPEYWDHPGQRLSHQKQALELLESELLTNIRLLNAGAPLEYLVRVDAFRFSPQ